MKSVQIENVISGLEKSFGVPLRCYHPRADPDRIAVHFKSLPVQRLMDLFTTLVGYGWVPDEIKAKCPVSGAGGVTVTFRAGSLVK